MHTIQNKYTEIDYSLIGERIKKLRGAESQSEFANKFGLSQTDISRIERGEVKPTPEILYNICIKYQKSLEWLFTGEEAPLRITEECAIYNDKEMAEIMEWFTENPQDRGAMMKFLQFLKSKKGIQEIVGAPEKNLLKEGG